MGRGVCRDGQVRRRPCVYCVCVCVCVSDCLSVCKSVFLCVCARARACVRVRICRSDVFIAPFLALLHLFGIIHDSLVALHLFGIYFMEDPRVHR